MRRTLSNTTALLASLSLAVPGAAFAQDSTVECPTDTTAFTVADLEDGGYELPEEAVLIADDAGEQDAEVCLTDMEAEEATAMTGVLPVDMEDTALNTGPLGQPVGDKAVDEAGTAGKGAEMRSDAADDALAEAETNGRGENPGNSGDAMPGNSGDAMSADAEAEEEKGLIGGMVDKLLGGDDESDAEADSASTDTTDMPAEPEVQASPEGAVTTQSDTTAEAETPAEAADAAPEADADSEGGLAGVMDQLMGGDEADTTADAEMSADTDAAADAEMSADADTAADAEMSADADTAADAEMSADADTAPDAEMSAEADAAPEADAEAEGGLAGAMNQLLGGDEEATADATAETGAAEMDAESAEADADAMADAEATTEADADAMADAEATTEADADAMADAETAEPTAEELQQLEQETADLEQQSAEEPDLQAEAETAEQDAPEVSAAAVTAESDATDAAEVQEETITEETSRSSSEEFDGETETLSAAAEAGASASNDDDDDDGLTDLEKALIIGLGAVVVGQQLQDNAGEVVSKSDDRVVVLRDGQYRIIKDDNELLRRPGSNVRTETFDDGSSRTTVIREDGSQIITLRDDELRVLRRIRVAENGDVTVLIDDTSTYEPVDVTQLPEPTEQVITVTQDRDALRQALVADVQTDRRFALYQVRNIRQVRKLSPAISLDNVTFETGSAVITPDQAEELADLGNLISEVIAENPNEVFLIEGHTDAVGNAAYNLALSDRRAESVALALTEYFDVPPENMVVQGYGEGDLKIRTLDAERENRRASVRRITPLLQTAELQ